MLGKFLASIGQVLLTWIGEAAVNAFREWVAEKRAALEIRAKAKAGREKTENATTPEERENAANDTRNW